VRASAYRYDQAAINQHDMTPTESKTYNICAYIGRDRILKELVEVSSAREAREIGKIVLRENGFANLKGIRFEAVRLD
jgi:hypothetical protein